MVYYLGVANDLSDERWRQTHLGQLLERASCRFDDRVLAVMARNVDLGLSLANLARRGALTASHIHITRHLPLEGCGLTELAQRAGVSKQAMGKLVDACCAWDLVGREPDPRDARATRILFTASGQQWLQAYAQAVQQAQSEFAAAVGSEVATVTQLGLEVYTS